jgi:PAS domain S-box-containing protein
LFIEDREDDMLLVLRALSKGGYRVSHKRVQNEEGVRELLSSESWDLVIADFSMPGFSGADALDIFKEYNLGIPFVLVSGSVGEDFAVQMMKNGASDYVMKDNLARIVPAIERELADFEMRKKKSQMEDELYRASLIIESTDVILWQWRPEPGWPVLYVSKNIAQFGYDAEDFVSGQVLFSEFIHPEDLDMVSESSTQNILGKKDLYKQSYRVITKDGSVRWLDDYTTIVRTASGEVSMVQGITYDITDSKQMGQDLERSRNLYRSLVDTSPDGICMMDLDFTTIFANKRKAELFGFGSPDELIGMNAASVIAPEYLQHLMELQPELMSFGRLSISEVEFVRKDRSRFFGELRMVLIRDEAGNPENIINLITDITERKQMQETLIESENRFRISFENAPIGMDMISLDSKIMRANKAFCDLIGYTEEELQNMSFYSITCDEDLSKNKDAVRRLLDGETDTVSLEKRYVRKDGTLIWVLVSSALIKNSQGKPLYFLAEVQDITQNKEAELQIQNAKAKAEESDRLKSALLANMSHELRTPLNGILGFSDIIRKGKVQPEIIEMAEMIHKSGKRLMTTLDSIMLLAQLESNRKMQDSSFVNANVSDELINICNTYRAEIEEKGLKLTCDIQTGIYIHCEIKLLRQAVIKIVENAIKFTHVGTISIAAHTSDDKVLDIMISDTGIGFSDKLKKEIFEEFRQVSEGYGRAYEGSGLGLSITKKIINLFNGSLLVDSEPNHGSNFTIRIPCTVSTEQVAKEFLGSKPKEIKPEPVDPDTLPPLLIVEDNPVNQKLASSFLKKRFQADIAATGEKAIEMATQKLYSVILMDINLGSGIDGIEATRIIRRVNGYEHVPIIAVTGYTLIGDRERILEGGCSHYLGKPFSKDQLLETIDTALER